MLVERKRDSKLGTHHFGERTSYLLVGSNYLQVGL